MAFHCEKKKAELLSPTVSSKCELLIKMHQCQHFPPTNQSF